MKTVSLLAAGLLPLTALSSCATHHAGEPRAATALEGRTVLAGCRQRQCSWLRVMRVEQESELRRIVARRGSSSHREGDIPRRAADARIAWENEDRAEYALCSTRRPAYAFPSDGGDLIVHFLDLFDLAGYQYSSATLYMAVCHGRDALPAEAVLRSLGYAPGTRSEQIEATGPEALTRF